VRFVVWADFEYQMDLGERRRAAFIGIATYTKAIEVG
jgi:hypothetical protein